MKIFYTIFLIFLGLIIIVHPVNAQECVEVISVETTQSQPLPLNSPITCIVTIRNGTELQKEKIACGISINGGYAQNYCPSHRDSEFNLFRGWRGNQGYFRCIIPNTSEILNATSLELVGDDFSSEFCKRSTRVAIPITIQRPTTAPNVTAPPIIESSRAEQFVEDLLKILANIGRSEQTPNPIFEEISPTITIENEPLPPGLNNEVTLVAQIVDQIRAQCADGVVNAYNLSCLNRVNLLGASAREILKNSARTYTQGKPQLNGLQCVGFVRAMLMQTTGRQVLQSGNAGDQLRNQSGYRAVQKNSSNMNTIKPGDVLIQGGSPGHIMYVMEIIDPARNRVRVAEANWTTATVERTRYETLRNTAIIGWLTKI